MSWPVLLAAVAPAAAPAAPVDGLGVGTNLLIATGLLVLGLGLIALEFILISGGAIGITAVACSVAAVWFAFAAGSLTGWIFTLLVPLSGFLAIRAGLQWMRTSTMVVQAEITAHAGYAHAASDHGVAVGSVGVLVTDAFPTGRARFAGPAGASELDVAVRGAVLGKGAAVVVRAIEGASIIVGPAPLPSPTPSAS
jgi:membrane-bound ClpP family serine protease